MYNQFLEYLKSNDPEEVISKNGIRVRKIVNPLLRIGARPTGHYRFKLEKKAKMPKNVPIIYAPTHGFKDDFLYTLSVIDDHAYVLFGSLPQFYHTIDGIASWVNGSIIVDREDSASRHASVEKMKRAIELGSNLTVFPEGVWNKEECLLILKLYSGIYKVAKETGAWVAPVATHVEKDTCYGSLGEAFDISKYSEKEGLQILRDKMATLKFELMDKYSHYSRKDLVKENPNLHEYWKDYIDGLIAQVDYYDYEVENKAMYKDPNESNELDVFLPVAESVKLTKDNAYVMSGVKQIIKKYN